MNEARVLADTMFFNDPYRVKHYHNVWGHVDIPPMKPSQIGLEYDNSGYFVLERVPDQMELSEQLELSAQKLTRLGLFEFLLRPAIREGQVSQSVIPISIADYLRDTENGELQFPDQALVSRYREGLAARSSIPVSAILKEQEQRLITGTTQEQQEPLQQVTTFEQLPAAESWENNGNKPSTENKPVTLKNEAHPEPNTVGETHSHPTLDDQQKAMLTFLTEHPDTPVSQLAKQLQIGAAQATMIRESLKMMGLLIEIELRTGKAGAGRPIKVVIPTVQAFELLGKDLPKGRGGVLHRHVQAVICDGATAKGYSAQSEKELDSGAIVDVYLERAGETVAVEIAVMSHPSRELAHIRQCLDAGYTKVFVVFADPQLLERTSEAVGMVFSDAECSRVQLIPLSKLASVG